MRVAGIDPGKKGALVSLDTNSTLVAAYPADLAGGYCDKGRGDTYNKRMMLDILRNEKPDLVIIEKQWSRAGESGVVGFATGLGFGLWLMALTATDTPFEVVSPQRWKAWCGILSGGKGAAIRYVEDRLPALNLSPGKSTNKHDGIAEAACMALCGRNR